MSKSFEANKAAAGADVGARIMLVLLCCAWGATWPLMRIALNEVAPFTMRTLAVSVGCAILFTVCIVKRRQMRLSGPKAWLHMAVAAQLNVTSFSIFSTFAQLGAATSRVAVLSYTVPIWTLVLGWIFLREKPTGSQPLGIALCAVGLAMVIYPVAGLGVPHGLLLAMATGASWAGGTIYLRWTRLQADPMAIAAWQVAVATVVIAICMMVFEGGPDFRTAHADGVISTIASGVLGTGIAYGLWFSIIERLPAMTASLGVLGSPVVGVASSILLLGERPTLTDYIGFTLILAASALALFGRNAPPAPKPAATRQIGP